jgi:glucose/arabinose dehydrogenase
MKPSIAPLGLVVALLLVAAPSASSQNVKDLWQNNCAACHGDDAGGGSAPSMLGDNLRTDGSNRALYDAIYGGIEDLGMPAFKGGLEPQEAWALVVYLHELRYDAAKDDIPQAPEDGVYDSQHHRYRVQTIVEGLENFERPWAIDFLPGANDDDPKMLVTERAGTLWLIDHRGEAKPIRDTPDVWEKGQGGLMDVAVHPDYADAGNGWVYLTYSATRDGKNNQGNTVLARGRIDLDALRWVDHEELFNPADEESYGSGVHFGSRIAFDDEGHVYFVVGERGQKTPSQKMDSVTGKVHRVHDDGRVPEDNPFVDTPTPTTWTLGHRNPQGLSFHPETGRLYAIEHAPRGGDEINLLEKGHNYGWPDVSYTMNYRMTPYGDSAPFHEPAGFVEPIHLWIPSIAICGTTFYTGDRLPKWKNDLFVAALAKQAIHRVRLGDDGRSVVEEEILLKGMGRVRDVVNGPGGALYAALERPGRIVKITPGDE